MPSRSRTPTRTCWRSSTAEGTKVVRHGRDLARGARAGVPEHRAEDPRPVGGATADLRRHHREAHPRRARRRGAPRLRPERGRVVPGSCLESPVDSLDANDRPGPPINLQSVVTRFKGRRRQAPVRRRHAVRRPAGERSAAAGGTRQATRARSAPEAPYSLAKLSHHGSPNAFNLDDLGSATPLVGICAGAESKDHPHRDVLEVLEGAQNRLHGCGPTATGCARSRSGPVRLSRSRAARLNDPRPNTLDAPVVEERTVRVTADRQPVEVVTRIPAGVRRVVVDDRRRPGRARRDLRPTRAGRWPTVARPAVRHRRGTAGRDVGETESRPVARRDPHRRADAWLAPTGVRDAASSGHPRRRPRRRLRRRARRSASTACRPRCAPRSA